MNKLRGLVLLSLFLSIFPRGSVSSDNIIVSGNTGSAYLKDSGGNLWPAAVGYTTDGNSTILTVNGATVATDNIIVPTNDGKAYLKDVSSRLFPAQVLFTTDGNGNVIPISAGGGGGGITSLNGLTTATQTFATGTSGTNFNVVSSSSTHTFNFPNSSSVNRGLLTAADWTTFNGKQASGNYITALTGDVTAAGPGSSAATVALVAGSTAANVHSAELAANAATSANTVSTIVKRDGSGNFSAGTVTANLTGNVTGNLTGTVTGSASLNVLKAGDTMTGPLAITGSSNAVQLQVTGNSTQTSPIFQVSNSTPTSLFKIDTNGNLTLVNLSNSLTTASTTLNIWLHSGASVKPAIVWDAQGSEEGISFFSRNVSNGVLTEVLRGQDNGSVQVAQINTFGGFNFGVGSGFTIARGGGPQLVFGGGGEDMALVNTGGDTSSSYASILHVTNGANVANPVLIAQGKTSQTGDLFQARNGSGSILSEVNSSGNLGVNVTSPATNLEVGGALRLSTTTTDTFTTPQSASVPTKINIPTFDPGSFGQVLAMGLPNSASLTSRAVTFFDARTSSHQPTLLIFSPNEGQAFGLGFGGGNTFGILQSSVGLSFQTNGLTSATEGIRIDTSGNVGIGNIAPSESLEVNGNAKANHLIGRTSAPTIVAGPGAGTGPTVSVLGTDTAGSVSILTGAAPSASATVATITFNVAYGSAPFIALTPTNASAAISYTIQPLFVTSTTTTFVLKSTTTALTSATTYTFNYLAVQ